MSSSRPSHQNRPKESKTCRFCFKTFSKVEHLSRHERSHTKERPFQCDICQKSYSRNDTLIRHRRVHKRVAGGPETPSDYDGVSSSSRVDDAAATLVDLQLLADRQNESQNRIDSGELPSMAYHGNRENDTDMQPMNQSLDDGGTGGTHDMENNPNLDFSSNGLLDPALQQYSQNTQASNSSFSPNMELWPMQNESFPSWHIGDDFDLESFNMCLRSPNFVDQISWLPNPSPRQGIDNMVSRIDIGVPRAPSMEEIQSLWITKADNYSWKSDGSHSYSEAPTRPITPTGDRPSGSTVDERYRHNLSMKLHPRWKEDPLPSTEFLNLALKLFFTRFNPVFPILHEPTFRPSNQNSLLLLSICSIGSLFMGSNSATAQGAKIFERLNKVILASWENIVTKKSAERISMVQASVLGQTFAYLSGDPKHLATVEAFHGTVVALARRSGMFNTTQKLPELSTMSPQEAENTWNEWARSEEITRAVLGLYVHDAQLASTFHHDPMLRHNAIPIAVASNDDLFAASTVAQWVNIVRSSKPELGRLSSYIHVNQHQHNCTTPLPMELGCKKSRLSCYVLLHGIGAAVQESSSAGRMDPMDMAKYQDALICWYHAYEETRPLQEPDTFCLMVLYHEIFMSLLVDFNELERAIGRDGSSEGADALKYVGPWSSTIEATRCVIHASSIYRHVCNMRVDSEPAIHVPRAIFLAAIAWYSYIQFDQANSEPRPFEEFMDIPEANVFNINPLQHLFEASGLKKGKPKLAEASTLYGLADMLYRIGHWGISKRLARILGLLLHGELDGHLMDAA